jgi:hypothetical protein
MFPLDSLQTSPEAQAYIAVMQDQLQGLSRIATHMLKFHRDGNTRAEFKWSAVLREAVTNLLFRIKREVTQKFACGAGGIHTAS